MESENISATDLQNLIRRLTQGLALLVLIWRLPDLLAVLLK